MDNCGECAELLQDGCEGIIGVCPESPVVRDYNAFTNKPSINGVTLVGNKTSEDLGIAQQITESVQAEAEARRQADNGLQSQIDAITSQSDVVDVVANYAALQAYDTSSLSDNDVIKVLDDETHEDALTYYRWSTETQTWSYIGQEAPYYSKGQMDVKLAEKQDKLTAGANIQIENGTISAETLTTEIVSSLPEIGEEGKLYLTPKKHIEQYIQANMPIIQVNEPKAEISDFRIYGLTNYQSGGTPSPTNPKEIASVVGGTIIATGKNLLDQSGMSSSFSAHGITGTYDSSTGIITLNGTCNTDNTVFALARTENVFVLNGDFTLSMEYLGGTISNATPLTSVQMFSNGHGNKISVPLGASNASSSFNKNKVVYTIKNFRIDNGVSFSNFKFRVMVEPGNFATSYEKNRTKYIYVGLGDYGISLNKLGDFADYIYKDGTQWKLHREIGEYEFDGSEAWFNSSETNSSVQVIALAINTLFDASYAKRDSSIMNTFVYNGDLATKNPGIFRLVNNASGKVAHIRLFLDKNDVQSLEQGVVWVETNKPKILFPKLTPTEEVITNQSLVAELDSILNEIELKSGVNTIKLYAIKQSGDFGIRYYELEPNDNNDEFIWANNKYEKLSDNLPVIDEGYVLDSGSDANNEFWSRWNARLAMGIKTDTAIVPTKFNGQIYANGMVIAHNTGDRSHNRHGLHIFEGYAKDDYSRFTVLVDKHNPEFDSKKSLEAYYYTGASHKNSAYGFFKIGSDVKYHSFLFDRDKMIAAGEIDCRFPVTLARINPATDLDDTYQTVEDADTAYEAESKAAENIKCLKYLALKNAQDGCMWYDTVRNKVVVKINGEWHDIDTTPVPSGTYNF